MAGRSITQSTGHKNTLVTSQTSDMKDVVSLFAREDRVFLIHPQSIAGLIAAHKKKTEKEQEQTKIF